MVERDCLAHERLERGRVNGFALMDVDRAPDVPLETRVEEAGRILQRRPCANVSFTVLL